MSLEATEKECAANAVAPRVSLSDIEGEIAQRHTFTAGEALLSMDVLSAANVGSPLHILTVCILVMNNGFVVIGKSAPASPENFNAELGKKLAYEDCIRQLWPLMGFALRDKLSEAA